MNLKINDTNLETIEESFFQIANELINKHVLVANNSIYRISNLEFYYFNETDHADENCHKKERQLLNSKWYLHKNSIDLKYNRKGIDFTFGDGSNYGGALIKETTRIDDNTKFSQSKFVDELIYVLDPSDANDFTNKIQENEELQFEKREDLKQYKIYQWKRIGLTKEIFKDSPYAFKVLLAK